MRFVQIEVDLSNIVGLDDFYKKMSNIFGFPSFFGNNIHALIDCLSYLPYPEAEMSNVHIMKSEYLVLEVFGFLSVSWEIREALVSSIESVNLRFQKDNIPPILLFFSRRR